TIGAPVLPLPTMYSVPGPPGLASSAVTRAGLGSFRLRGCLETVVLPLSTNALAKKRSSCRYLTLMPLALASMPAFISLDGQPHHFQSSDDLRYGWALLVPNIPVPISSFTFELEQRAL